jgi:hypothetical protein
MAFSGELGLNGFQLEKFTSELMPEVKSSACRLPESPAGGHDDAGHNARQRCGQEHPGNRLPVRRAEAEAAFPVQFGNALKRVFGHRRQRRDIQNRNGKRAGEQVPVQARHDEKHKVAEQADHDGRQRSERFNAGAQKVRHPAVSGVFGHVDSRGDANRDGDQKRQENQIDRVEKLDADSLTRKAQIFRLECNRAPVQNVDGKCGEQNEKKSGNGVKNGGCGFVGNFRAFVQ